MLTDAELGNRMDEMGYVPGSASSVAVDCQYIKFQT